VNLQRSLATAAMVFGVFYFPTAVTRNAMYDESSIDALDVVTAQLYRSTTGFATVTAAALVSLVGPTSTGGAVAACAIVTGAAVWCLLCSVVYGRVVNPQEGDFTTYALLSRFKKVAYAAASVGAVCSLAVAIRAHRQGQQGGTLISPLNDAWAAWVCVACAAAGVVFVPLLEFIARNAPCFASATAAPLSPFESTVDRARRLLLQLEQQLADAGCMGAAWLQQRGAWRRRVESAMRLSTVAAATMYLESCIRAVHLNAPFLRTRAAWLAEIKSLVDPIDEDEVSVSVVVNAMYAYSGHDCCESSCGCCSCGDSSYGSATRARHRNDARLSAEELTAAAIKAAQSRHDLLIRVVQGIVNAVTAAEDHPPAATPHEDGAPHVSPRSNNGEEKALASRPRTRSLSSSSSHDGAAATAAAADDGPNDNDDDGGSGIGPVATTTTEVEKHRDDEDDEDDHDTATRAGAAACRINAPFGAAESPGASRRASAARQDNTTTQNAIPENEGSATDAAAADLANDGGDAAAAASHAIAHAATDIAAAIERGVDDDQW
jgi:hypothetical protein